ncbi:hypothetical protein GCM10009864_68810 [Streptomyces lunalinharesii]|uniref:Uncharacterized protein n=1 Tax=Streptomyces lunalinharesii TaxID=333384 RepID=A0ABP6F716_9ACTN
MRDDRLERGRCAGQAASFAGRIARADQTGIDGPQVNEAGLEAARRWFADQGADRDGDH